MSTTAEVQHIDEDINGLKFALFKLNTQRNSLVPIYRLPAETLASIFILLARDFYYSSAGRWARGAPNWVNVSYVCRHWRDVALNCATLWTYVFVTSSRWTDELLARSGEASLKIRVVPRDPTRDVYQASYFVEQVMKHADRIQELYLRLYNIHDHAILSKLTRDTPRLQNLDVMMPGVAQSQWPPGLFGGHTPALRTLRLSDCSVPWSSFTVNGLTTLRLSNYAPGFRWGMTDILALLSDMRDLVHLYLDEVFSSFHDLLSSGKYNATPRVDLPRLSGLRVVAPLSAVIAFLSHVNVPLTTQLRLACQSERRSSPTDYAQMLSLLKPRLDTSDNSAVAVPAIRSLLIDADPARTWFSFNVLERASPPSYNASFDDWDRNIPVQLEIQIDLKRLAGFCCSIPPTNIETLCILNPPSSLDFWKKMFRYFRNIRRMELYSGDMPNIASLLSVPLGDCGRGGYIDQTTNQLLPDLDELELDEIEFRVSPQALYDALATRTQSTGKLTITNGYVKSEGADDDDEWEELAVEGCWEGGSFRIG